MVLGTSNRAFSSFEWRESRYNLTKQQEISHFKGHWLVNYQKEQYTFQDILVILLEIQDYFNKNGIEFENLNVKINNKGDKSHYFKENQTVYLNIGDNLAEFEEIGKKPEEIAKFKALGKPVKTVSLLFPRLESDPRWRSMGMPAGQLLLSSSLKAHGFEPVPLALAIPGKISLSGAFSVDLAGFTLFEDLLPLLRPVLADFRLSYRGIVAAGGPFPTLAPMAAMYHLPEINLMVRGEAEFVLPGILAALNKSDAEGFFSHEGVFWHHDGVIAMAGFDKVVRPDDLASLPIDLGFLKPNDLGNGLEMNFSRGCRRGCVFCCRAQGSRMRKMPPWKAGELLSAYAGKVDRLGAGGVATRTVNINDDDILQDPAYARDIFAAIKRQGLRIFGIQTSTASLAKADGSPNAQVLELAADSDLFVNSAPLLWLGTDTFLQGRAQRLGKKLPPPAQFRELLAEMERRRIRHYHYWISSDGDSTWPEFVGELESIFSLFKDFPNFGLLAHAPFLVPYPSSVLFSQLPESDPRLKIKLDMEAPDPRFRYKVVERMEASWPQLNALLRNEKAGGEKGFFDFLKEKDLTAAAQLGYHFLKQEMFQDPRREPELQIAKGMLEEVIEDYLDRGS